MSSLWPVPPGGPAEDELYALKERRAVRLPPSFLDRRPSVPPWKLFLCMDWLFAIAVDLCLQEETFALACGLFTRALATRREVPLPRLQLCAAVCLAVASKLLEVDSPTLGHVAVECTHGAAEPPQYMGRDAVVEEREVLASLNHNLLVPTPYDFLVRFKRFADCERAYELARYACLSCCFSLPCYALPPSHVAAACFAVGVRQAGDRWTEDMQRLAPNPRALRRVVAHVDAAAASGVFPELKAHFDALLHASDVAMQPRTPAPANRKRKV